MHTQSHRYNARTVGHREHAFQSEVRIRGLRITSGVTFRRTVLRKPRMAPPGNHCRGTPNTGQRGERSFS